MISNEFGDRGIDRNYDGILQHSEIDIKSRGAIPGFGIPHTASQESPPGTSSMAGIQKPMFGGCFEVSPIVRGYIKSRNLGIDVINAIPGVNVPSSMPTPVFKDGILDEFTCVYGSKTGNTWTYDVDTQRAQCKTSTGNIVSRESLKGDSFPISTPLVNKDYKINCEYTLPTTGNEWREDYLRPDNFEEKSLLTILHDIDNGRVGDIDIFKDIDVKTEDFVMKHDNQETAVKGIIEETALSNHFFSDENMKALQDTLCYEVYQQTQEYIDYQSSQEIYIVMRSILLQHGNFKVSSSGLLDELRKLNKLVIKYCVKEVSSNVLQYKGYLNDLQRLPIPIDRPSYDESGSRNRTYDLSNHIAPVYSSGWGSRHSVS